MFWLFQAIEVSFGAYQSAKNSNNEWAMRLYHRLLITGLKGLQAYLDWIPFTYVLSFWAQSYFYADISKESLIFGKYFVCYWESSLLEQYVGSLNAHSNCSKKSAECLILLMSRGEKRERDRQLSLFEFVPLITRSMTVISNDFDDDYAFQKRVSQVGYYLASLIRQLMSLLGSKHLQYCDYQKQIIMPPNYEMVLTFSTITYLPVSRDYAAN